MIFFMKRCDCPRCHSDQFTEIDMDYSDNNVVAHYECDDCGNEFTVVYHAYKIMNGYKDMDEMGIEI